MRAQIIVGCLLAFCTFTLVKGQANFNTSRNYDAVRYVGIPSARGIICDENGDIVAVTSGTLNSRLTLVYEENGLQTLVLINTGTLRLNHGIAYNNGYLYASSATTVYRWPYIPGQRTAISTAETVVVRNIPTGGHTTRSLAFDRSGLLYISIGSNANVDPNSDRARIRRFNVTSFPNGGIEFNSGIVFADGLRNEVGLAFDPDDVLWGVQNGADNLNREDLGGDIHNTNPAEELTKYDKPLGTHYGYPYCWTVDSLSGYSQGDQFAWPTFMNDGVHTDAWCRNASNNHPPTLPLPAHYAPLGITFYDGKACDTGNGSFPCSMTGDAFVAFHGSWNREPPAGYRVVRIPIDPRTRLPTGEVLDIMWEPNPAECGRCMRPVDVVFDHKGRLIVSADASSELFLVTYKP